MSNSFKKIALALAIGLVLVQVFPVAADLLVCIDDRPDRGCCDSPSTSDKLTDAALQLVDGADCNCCVRVHVASNAADATVQKVDAGWSVESVGLRGPVAPVSRPIASVGGEDPDNPRLPSLRTVVLLI
jgi:hypothetical protein